MSLTRVGINALRNVRQYSTPSKLQAKYAKLNALKEKFAVEDGVPVHLKRGLVDRVLFGVTMVTCGVAVVWDFKIYYDFSFK